MFKLQHEAFNRTHQSTFQSLLQTYVNEVYELMHDLIRIITLPLASKQGAISYVS